MIKTIYLIVTMASSHGLSYEGYGAVSITETPSMTACLKLKEITINQLKKTKHLDFDDIIIECETIEVDE